MQNLETYTEKAVIPSFAPETIDSFEQLCLSYLHLEVQGIQPKSQEDKDARQRTFFFGDSVKAINALPTQQAAQEIFHYMRDIPQDTALGWLAELGQGLFDAKQITPEGTKKIVDVFERVEKLSLMII